MKPSIAYAAVLPPKRYKEYSRMDMYGMLFQQFARETGVSKNDIEAAFVTAHSFGMAEEQIIDYLKLSPKRCAAFDVGGATTLFMLKQAMTLIESGEIKNAVILGTGKFDDVDREMALLSTSHPDFEAFAGPSMPGFYALFAQRYMHDFALTEEELALVSVAQRRWANLNEDAFMHEKPLSVHDVVSSPYIATPFRLFDCSIPLSGGGLVFITAEKTKNPVYLKGYGEAHRYGFITTNEDFTSTSAVKSGKRAFEDADISHDALDVLEIYDAFSICPVILLEDLGFYEKGKGIEFYKQKRGEPGGSLPLNTYGGLLSFGHPGMPAGFHVLVEGVRQLQGACGKRQVKNAKTALVHCYGGMFANHITTILTNEQ